MCSGLSHNRHFLCPIQTNEIRKRDNLRGSVYKLPWMAAVAFAALVQFQTVKKKMILMKLHSKYDVAVSFLLSNQTLVPTLI